LFKSEFARDSTTEEAIYKLLVLQCKGSSRAQGGRSARAIKAFGEKEYTKRTVGLPVSRCTRPAKKGTKTEFMILVYVL